MVYLLLCICDSCWWFDSYWWVQFTQNGHVPVFVMPIYIVDVTTKAQEKFATYPSTVCNLLPDACKYAQHRQFTIARTKECIASYLTMSENCSHPSEQKNILGSHSSLPHSSGRSNSRNLLFLRIISLTQLCKIPLKKVMPAI
jgi:hypothetical protein